MLIGAPRLTPTEHVFKELKWTDISTQWQQQKLCMVFKISKGDAPEYMLNYFEEVKKNFPLQWGTVLGQTTHTCLEVTK